MAVSHGLTRSPTWAQSQVINVTAPIKELCLSISTNRLPDVSQVQLLEHSESSSKNPVPVPVCELSIPRDRCDSRLQRSDPSRDDVKPFPLVAPQVYPSARSVRNKLLQETPLRSSDSRARLSYAAQVSVDITRPSVRQDDIPRFLVISSPFPRPRYILSHEILSMLELRNYGSTS
ncbi:hypothetical protein M404DRAFT_33829 [Pisolithus tinctorius Marx 270]|uniref:Uncharacterized protein n=1 Tax=Pisolithus tinctorius Marx 270 TaxID=870435 RepID=A0A0C3NKP9_PISTI|nr:hypothetical protein M404DRAFT_33829 [Pisolithus tinctorius Marx 270]